MTDHTFERRSSPDGGSHDFAEALGGADGVQKTTYGVGRGTDPRQRMPISPDQPQGPGTEVAKLSALGRKGVLWAVVLSLLAGVLLAYFYGARR